MTFVYFPYEFYRISNAIAYKTLILNYNSGFNLGICLFFFFNNYIFRLWFLKLNFIYIIKKKNCLTLRFDQWPTGWITDPVTLLINQVNIQTGFNSFGYVLCGEQNCEGCGLQSGQYLHSWVRVIIAGDATRCVWRLRPLPLLFYY